MKNKIGQLKYTYTTVKQNCLIYRLKLYSGKVFALLFRINQLVPKVFMQVMIMRARIYKPFWYQYNI